MSWLLFTLLAVNLWVVSNIIDKNVVSKRIRSVIIPIIIGGFGNILYAAFAFLIFGATFSFEGFILGIIYVLVILLYYKALRLEEASRVIAFFGLVPIFVSVIAYFLLGEQFGSIKYIGILLVVFGAILISVKKRYRISISKALHVMLLMVIFYAVYSIAMKYSVDAGGFVSIFAGMQLGGFLCGFSLLFPYRRELVKLKAKTISLVLISQLFGVAGLLSFIYAVSLGPITLISAIENIQPVFVLLYVTILTILKPHIIEEEISKGPLLLKAVAIIVIVIGAYLVGT